MKTLLQIEIERVKELMYKQSQTSWYDSGVRDVLTEGYLKGLEKAQRLVNKQKRIMSDSSDKSL